MPKALASAPRLELLDLLSQAPRTVERLAEAAGLNLANASQHLQVLRQAGLVETERRGVFVTYRLAGDDVADLFLAIRSVAARRVAAVESVARQGRNRRERTAPGHGRDTCQGSIGRGACRSRPPEREPRSRAARTGA